MKYIDGSRLYNQRSNMLSAYGEAPARLNEALWALNLRLFKVYTGLLLP